MRYKLILLSLVTAAIQLVLISSLHGQQQRHTLTGTVVHAQDARDVITGASIFIPALHIGAVSDLDGRFTLNNVPTGEHQVEVRFVGFNTTTLTVIIPQTEPLRVELVPGLFRTQDVIVTANPTRSPVQYQASQAYTETELTRRASLSLGEMLDGEPGLSSRSFGSGPARPVIRGLDGERLIVLENGERMGDIQTTAPDHAITLDPFGMSRVEVVRGPASLLYGSSALGGVINIFSEDFARDWEPGVTGGINSHLAHNNALVSGAAGLQYGTENIAVTGRFIRRVAGDFDTPGGLLPNSGLDSYTTSVGVGFRGSRGLTGGISARYYQNHYGVPEFAAGTDETNPGLFIEEEPDMEVRIYRYNIQAALNQQRQGAFFDEIDFRISLSQSLQEEGEPDPLPEELELEIFTRTLSSTVMFMHRPVGILARGVIGSNLHLRYQEVDGIEAYHPGEDITNLAVFTFQEIPLSHTMRLQFGVRAEHEWINTTQNRFFPADERFSETFFNFAGSFGFNLRPGGGFELGAQLARAHRNPTVLELFADGWHAGATRIELGDPDLRSEIGYGIDFFSRWTGQVVQLELSGFYNRVDNFVALRTLPFNCGGLSYRVIPDREFASCVQFFRADAHLRGFEFVATSFLTPEFRIRTGLDYVQGDRRDADEPLPFIPPFRGTISAMYDNGSFNIGSDIRMVAAQTRVPENELTTNGYAVLRFEAGYRFGNGASGVHSFNLRVDNLLNTSYQDHMSVVRRFPDPVEGPNAPARFDMPGRNVNLIYRYVF